MVYVRKLFRKKTPISVGGEITPTGSLSVKLNANDGREAIRENTEKAKSSVDVDIEGKIEQKVLGQSYLNEENTLPACVNLVNYLNENGETWQQPTLRDFSQAEGVDCYSLSLQDSEKKLNIQVTRIAHKRTELAQIGFTESKESADNFAREIFDAIEHKKTLADKANITLLIDCTDTPNALTKAVRNVVIQKYSKQINEIGFQRIWLCGSSTNLVYEITS
jgi:hypothetical protein